MFYEIPKNVKETYKKLSDNPTIDNAMERSVLSGIIQLKDDGYEVTTKKVYINDKECSSVYINGTQINWVKDMCEFSTLIITVCAMTCVKKVA